MKIKCDHCGLQFDGNDPLPGMHFATVQCPSCKHYFFAQAPEIEKRRCSVCDKQEGVVTIDFSGVCLTCRLPNL